MNVFRPQTRRSYFRAFFWICSFIVKILKTINLTVKKKIRGNICTENKENIHVHKYGAHIFHTNNKEVWEYVTKFAEFNRFTNSPVANYKGELYSLFYTFNKMWGVVTPQEAAAKIEKQWGCDGRDLPAFIIKRLPVRLTFDNNYFNALY